jgi:hypothetical protein
MKLLLRNKHIEVNYLSPLAHMCENENNSSLENIEWQKKYCDLDVYTKFKKLKKIKKKKI